MKGYLRTVIMENGKEIQSMWPTNRDDALLEKTVYFYPVPFDPCPREDHEPQSVVYTKTGIKRCCSLRDAYPAYKEAKLRGEPTDPSMAIRLNFSYYWKAIPGKFCGHNGKTLINGKCWYCEEEKNMAPPSPRQAAIANGEKWYQPLPGDLCKNGHNSPRRVDNGVCQECMNKGSDGRVNETRIDRLYPDMIISFEDAKANGFNVFRTGKPCRKGHTGWRYVSTRGCLECLGR